ncbi:MAG: DUF1178 family protein [Sphingomonadales bacterium]|nr:DUF1178 family protein [Sphingomonadales bacterium]
MIVFDLSCSAHGHRFEGWFGSSEDFANQQARGLVTCPQCGSADVLKAPMAPAVPRKGNQQPSRPTEPIAGPETSVPAVPSQMVTNAPMPPEAVKMMQALAKMQTEALKSSRWVGGKFAEESRAMHYGESEAEPIHGEATLDEARALLEEGVEVAPLPFPVVPPGKAN